MKGREGNCTDEKMHPCITCLMKAQLWKTTVHYLLYLLRELKPDPSRIDKLTLKFLCKCKGGKNSLKILKKKRAAKTYSAVC